METNVGMYAAFFFFEARWIRSRHSVENPNEKHRNVTLDSVHETIFPWIIFSCCVWLLRSFHLSSRHVLPNPTPPPTHSSLPSLLLAPESGESLISVGNKKNCTPDCKGPLFSLITIDSDLPFGKPWEKGWEITSWQYFSNSATCRLYDWCLVIIFVSFIIPITRNWNKCNNASD